MESVVESSSKGISQRNKTRSLRAQAQLIQSETKTLTIEKKSASESNLLALSQAKKLLKITTQMKNVSHASRIPSLNQSPICHSTEWKTPLLPSPAS
ncbi:hypothetical protein TNCV_429441 [Trichonephila clavipes]|nr:hypothetical protein TNCV_429441 [Trichonephila clavipes]